MSARGQAGKQAAPQLVPSPKEAGHRLARATGELPCSKWSVYRYAIEGGWGSTCRLCLILIFRCGIPVTVVTGGVKLVSILWGHAH